MTKLIKIEGVGEVFARKLEEAGVSSIEGLLEAGATAKGRQELEAKTGIDHTFILRWVNHGDLFRIKGVGEEYAELLESAGVDTVAELAQRRPDNLLEKLVAVNHEKHCVRHIPGLSQVQSWVDHAKQLPRKVSY